MSTMKLSAKGGGDFFRLRFWAAALLLLGISLMLCMGEASALAPAAGSSIGNQASATYTDGNNISRITVSNSVTTVVAQVFSSVLVQSQTRSGAPGQPITFAHSITNNGNGPDTYNIGTAAFAGTALTVVPSLYADANCDGVADNTTVITSVGPVPANSVACFVAQGALANSGTTSTFNVTAASTGAGAPAIPLNTDTANILPNGVINISKSVSTNSGPSGTTVTYTLTYRNTGTAAVTGLVIADTLQPGVAFATALNASVNGTIVAATVATATGSVTGVTSSPLASVAVGTATGTTKTIVAVLASVPANSQGTFTYQAVQSGGPVNYNTAQFCYNDGGGNTIPSGGTVPAATTTACSNIITGSGATTGTTSGSYLTTVLVDSNLNSGTGIVTTNNPSTTNTVPFTVLTGPAATGLVTFNDGTTTNGTPGGDGTVGGVGTPVDGTNVTLLANVGTAGAADLNVVASAAQGATVTFNNWVWNTGTASDSYNITAGPNNFPAGTSFLYLRSDGNTPLTDSDGDGKLDTGAIAGTLGNFNCPAGSPNLTAATGPCAYRVVVKAILPANASGAGPFSLIVQAASSNTPATTNTVVDSLTALSAAKVNLLNPQAATGTYTIGATGTCPGATDVTPTPGSPIAGITCSQYVNGGGATQTFAGEPAFVTSVSANPGTTVIYKLDVKNDVPVTSTADSFDLTYATGSGGFSRNIVTGVVTYGGTALPQGFAVNFYVPTSTDCSGTFGAAVSNTGVIAPGATKLICAVVTTPATASAATYEMFFRALSPTSYTGDGTAAVSSADVIHDRLIINSFRSVSLTPNGNGQVFPGGSIAYCHTLTNLGNVAESGNIGPAGNVASPATPAWPANATFYVDTDKNCQLNGTEGSAPLAAAAAYALPVYSGAGTNTLNYIVVIQAPSTATAGQTVTTSLSATSAVIGGTTTPAVQTATDTTTVVVGQVTLVKSQLLDTTCTSSFAVATLPAGTPAGTFGTAQIAAKPGDCIIYQVVATNIGTTTVNALQVFDATPPNTTCYGTPWYVPAGAAVAGGLALTAGTNYTAGACTPATTAATNVNTTGQTLSSNQSTTLYMRVKVNQ